MATIVDLNCDMGESFGAYKIGLDEEVAKYISSANVACGFHASDPVVMDKTVKILKENNVNLGAHPGYPDLMGFGRRNMNVSPADAKAYVMYQIGALSAFAKANGLKIQHVKPHGALYNTAGKDYALSKAICEGIYEVKCAKEVFADRAYEEDGSLVARTKPGAVITDEDEAIKRVIGMVKHGKVTTITGKEIAIEANSICVHGDGAKALEFVRKIRAALTIENIKIAPLCEMV